MMFWILKPWWGLTLELKTSLFWHSPITGIGIGIHIEKPEPESDPTFIKEKNLPETITDPINSLGTETAGTKNIYPLVLYIYI